MIHVFGYLHLLVCLCIWFDILVCFAATSVNLHMGMSPYVYMCLCSSNRIYHVFTVVHTFGLRMCELLPVCICVFLHFEAYLSVICLFLNSLMHVYVRACSWEYVSVCMGVKCVFICVSVSSDGGVCSGLIRLSERLVGINDRWWHVTTE